MDEEALITSKHDAHAGRVGRRCEHATSMWNRGCIPHYPQKKDFTAMFHRKREGGGG